MIFCNSTTNAFERSGETYQSFGTVLAVIFGDRYSTLADRRLRK